MPEPSSAGRLVHAAAFAEPGAVLAGDRWWAAAGTGPAGSLPTLSSIDLVHWQREPSALPRLGDWAVPGSTRAPELVEASPVEPGPDRWLLFHGATRAHDGSAVIGVATATEAGGVFTDALGGPLVAGTRADGVSDPAVSTIDGTRWLSWVQECSGDHRTRIRTCRLTEDGPALAGAPVTVLAAEYPWQAGVVAAPRLVPTSTGVVMFYAAGARDSGGSSIALARADRPDAPFVADVRPLLISGRAYEGPGHPAVVADPDGRWWLLFSARATGRTGEPGAGPSLWLAALDLDAADGPTVGDPVPPPRPLPVLTGRWRLPLPADPTVDQERVIRAFTVHGAIRALPARAHLRVVLLDLLAQLFEPGVRYPESEVDRRLTGIWAPGVHPDYARLRRLLVDHGFLDRRDGIYRRSGGTVAP